VENWFDLTGHALPRNENTSQGALPCVASSVNWHIVSYNTGNAKLCLNATRRDSVVLTSNSVVGDRIRSFEHTAPVTGTGADRIVEGHEPEYDLVEFGTIVFSDAAGLYSQGFFNADVGTPLTMTDQNGQVMATPQLMGGGLTVNYVNYE